MHTRLLCMLQQLLPFTVLKLPRVSWKNWRILQVATALTVYGIETLRNIVNMLCSILLVATALTVYGIETVLLHTKPSMPYCSCNSSYRLRYWNSLYMCDQKQQLRLRCNSSYRLRYWNSPTSVLPVLMLALSCNSSYRLRYWNGRAWKPMPKINSSSVATALTVYGIETHLSNSSSFTAKRLPLQQLLPFTVLKQWSSLLHYFYWNF